MTISIIVVTRNRSEHLDECLSSILKQTISPKEIYVIDNNSTDNTYSICVKYLSKLPIRYYKELNTGIAYARQAGLEKSSGDILVYVDDDCIVDKNWLKSISDSFELNPKKIIAIQGKSLSYWKDWLSLIEQYSYDLWFKYAIDDLNKPNILKFGSYTDTKNFAINRNFVIKNKLYFNHLAPHKSEDTEFGIKMKQSMKDNQLFIFQPRMLIWHKHPNTIKSFIKKNLIYGYNQNYLQQYKDFREMHNLYKPYIERNKIHLLDKLNINWLKKYILQKINRLIFTIGSINYQINKHYLNK